MKLAFCLYGLSGNYSENGAHLRLNRGCAHTFEIMKYSFESYKKNFYDVNKDFTIDTYFHTRNHKNIDKIIDLYKPKKYIVQEKLTIVPKIIISMHIQNWKVKRKFYHYWTKIMM